MEFISVRTYEVIYLCEHGSKSEIQCLGKFGWRAGGRGASLSFRSIYNCNDNTRVSFWISCVVSSKSDTKLQSTACKASFCTVSRTQRPDTTCYSPYTSLPIPPARAGSPVILHILLQVGCSTSTVQFSNFPKHHLFALPLYRSHM